MAAHFWRFHSRPVSCHRICARLLIGDTPVFKVAVKLTEIESHGNNVRDGKKARDDFTLEMGPPRCHIYG